VLGTVNGSAVQIGRTLATATRRARKGIDIPEPTTALLLTLGLAGLGMRRRVH